jgi:hypothetical protein
LDGRGPDTTRLGCSKILSMKNSCTGRLYRMARTTTLEGVVDTTTQWRELHYYGVHYKLGTSAAHCTVASREIVATRA